MEYREPVDPSSPVMLGSAPIREGGMFWLVADDTVAAVAALAAE
ncbi:MAG: hypothetical protein ACRDFX_09375 [Chloroflexota bacterium]